MTIQEHAIIEALEKRQEYILANLESMTMKALRRVLEQDLQLEQDALKPMKKVVNNFVDNLLIKARSKQQVEEDTQEKKNSCQLGGREEKKGRDLTRRFIKMRNICKQATITIPPSLYRKDCDSKDMESGILEILKKNGLDENSPKASIMAVKEKLQIQRDLDGIDTSNIIDDGPRSRRKAMRYLDHHSISEEGDEENEGFSSRENESESDTSLEGISEEDEKSADPTVSVSKRTRVDAWSDED